MKIKNYLFITITFLSSFVYSQTGTTLSGSFMSGGVSRSYTYYVPAIYNTANKPVPMIFNLHGFTGSSAAQEIYEDFRTIADTANFIVVHPQGLNQTPFPGFSAPGWASMTTVAAGAADKAFLMSLLDTIEAKYKINVSKVYSTGYSQGAFMSYNLACFYSSRFAAIASSCGSMSFDNLTAGTPAHPTPIMEIHGTTDGIIPYAGSSTYLQTDSLVQHWVKFNHCNPSPTIDTLPDINTTDNCRPVHYVYKNGDLGSTVEFYKIIGGGHQVPSIVATASYGAGLGNRNMDFTASKEIWRFFSQYSLDMFTGITEQKGDVSDVSIYPNPSNGIFTVELKNNINADLTIYNALGEIVFTEKNIKSTQTINIGQPIGIYFYQISNQLSVLKSGKLLVQ